MGSEELLLEAGKSNELAAVLHTLSETEVNGEAKFSPLVCREIGKLIVCRTYAPAVLELCHLIVIASELSCQRGRYEFLFWDSGVAKTSSFFSYCTFAFKDYEGSLIASDRKGITLTYEDSNTFSIQFNRMPTLSALLELMLTALGYTDIDEAFQSLLTGPITKKSVSDCANSLSRLIYSYLKNHLPTAQSQRKFRKALAYCENDVDAIDDAMILNFWQDASTDKEKGVDFKTFDTVFLTFIRMIEAVEAARDLSAMQHAGSIGSDREAGEIDPDMLSETLCTVEETITPLLKLTSSPLNLVKFLNKQETGNLECLLNAGELALRLPLSILRSDTFTKAQSRLTQALRTKIGPDVLTNIIDEGPEETYQDRQVTYASLKKHLERMVYASLHALIKARMKEAVPVLLKLSPGIDFSPLAAYLLPDEENTNVPPINNNGITERFIEFIHNEGNASTDLAEVIANAQAAHTGISRKGFKDDITQNTDLAYAFSEGAELLLDIARDIDAYLERLDNLPLAGGGWQSQFSYDRTIFCGQFSKIYGATS